MTLALTAVTEQDGWIPNIKFPKKPGIILQGGRKVRWKFAILPFSLFAPTVSLPPKNDVCFDSNLEGKSKLRIEKVVLF